MESCRRLLCCVKYPFFDTIDPSAQNDRVHLVTWLEDNIIRSLAIDDRLVLRTYSELWDPAFSNYLSSMGCPFQWSEEPEDCLNWMIGEAVEFKAEDMIEPSVEKQKETDEKEEKEGVNENESDAMVVDDDSVEGAVGDQSTDMLDVDSIGTLLGISRIKRESDPDYLQRISKVISLTLTSGSLEALLTKNKGGISLEEFPLGFDTGDKDINEIATVLKMLYLSDFRELQNDLNALIALGQEFTENTRTNPALGKVGR